MKHAIPILFLVVVATMIKAQPAPENYGPVSGRSEAKTNDTRRDVVNENESRNINDLEDKWFGDAAWPEDSVLNENPEEKARLKNYTREYYLIVGVMKKISDAEELVNSLKPRGFIAKIKQAGDDGLYYVHIPCYSTEQITYDQMTDVRHEFENAWYQRLE